MAFVARASALRAAGREIVGLAAGEPDVGTPTHVIEALEQSIRSGQTRYPPALGVASLREAVARHASRRYLIPFEATQVAVTPGAKMALWAAFQLLVDPGDEVLVPSPCWVSYQAQIAHAGGRMITVAMSAADGFSLNVEAIEQALTPRTVGIVLNLPNNPTGALASQEALDTLAELAVEHDLWLVCDDIYAELRFEDGPYPSPLKQRPELLDRTVIIDGLSKSHAMTGWRVGWAIAAEPLIRRFGALLGQTVTGVTTFVQHAATVALEGDWSFLGGLLAGYRRRSERVVAAVNALGLAVAPPRGAFYALLDVSRALGGALVDDAAFVTRLLEDEGVALVPGSAFFAPGFARLSYACDDAVLDQGLERLGRFVTDHLRS